MVLLRGTAGYCRVLRGTIGYCGILKGYCAVPHGPVQAREEKMLQELHARAEMLQVGPAAWCARARGMLCVGVGVHARARVCVLSAVRACACA